MKTKHELVDEFIWEIKLLSERYAQSDMSAVEYFEEKDKLVNQLINDLKD